MFGQKQTVSDEPVAVVQVLSVRGVEYAMQALTLWAAAATLVSLAVSLINGQRDFNSLSMPLSILIVTLPIFAWLFIRLRKQELINPSLRLEASRRRYSVLTQLVTFVVSVITLISLVYFIMRAIGGEEVGSIWKYVASSLVVLVVSGGIFLYYWLENHAFWKWGKK